MTNVNFLMHSLSSNHVILALIVLTIVVVMTIVEIVKKNEVTKELGKNRKILGMVKYIAKTVGYMVLLFGAWYVLNQISPIMGIIMMIVSIVFVWKSVIVTHSTISLAFFNHRKQKEYEKEREAMRIKRERYRAGLPI